MQVQGLLIGASGPASAVGTTGPVTMVGATLVCGGSGGAVVPVAVAVTPSPLSSSGNAQIDQDVTLPAASACFGPVVLVQVFDTTAAQLSPVFIAVTGLTPNAAQTPNQDRSGDGGHGN